MSERTKIAIGCLVQWYEIDIIEEYINSIINSLSLYDKDLIFIDFYFSKNTELEQPIKSNVVENNYNRFIEYIDSIPTKNVFHSSSDKLVTISDYRRKFNDTYSDIADVLIWGESDMLLPKQAFPSIDLIHTSQKEITPKYIATFSICKMWDTSWTPLEHPEFSKMPFIENDYENWWSLKYTMSIEEMNKFNEKVEELDISVISPFKFNGCGLVISSEVIKAGVNIPKSVFFVHEDTAFMLMLQKVLNNIPQYHFKNILLVHNRNHPKKRNYIKGEIGDTLNQKRRSNDWYVKANKYSEENCYNLFNPSFKFKDWSDVWK